MGKRLVHIGFVKRKFDGLFRICVRAQTTNTLVFFPIFLLKADFSRICTRAQTARTLQHSLSAAWAQNINVCVCACACVCVCVCVCVCMCVCVCVCVCESIFL